MKNAPSPSPDLSCLNALSVEDLVPVLADYLAGRRKNPAATSREGFRAVAQHVLKQLVLGAG